MDEVAKQLKPFLSAVDKLHDWQLAFWSNGSGRPEGFFQMRMKADDERNRRDAEEKAQIKSDLKTQTEIVASVAGYIDDQKKAKERRVKRWKFWWPYIWKIGGAICAGILSLAIPIGIKASHVIYILWQDYEHYHPGLSDQIKHANAHPETGVSSNQSKETSSP